MKKAVIVSATRTAVGKFGGSLKNIPAYDLGSIVIQEAVKRADIDPALVDEVILGNVLSAGLGQNVARQVQLGAGIPVENTAFTVGKVWVMNGFVDSFYCLFATDGYRCTQPGLRPEPKRKLETTENTEYAERTK